MANDNHRERQEQPQSFEGNTIAAIYDEYYLPIYRYIYRQVSDVETARDLTSEVFHRLLHAAQKGMGPSQDARAWLYRTGYNIVIDHYRRQQHRRHLPLYEQFVDGNMDPVSMAEDRLTADTVHQALNHLTPDQRQVISLKFLAGLSNKEVAQVMNKPIGAVKSLQHRALAALQRQLLPAKEKALV